MIFRTLVMFVLINLLSGCSVGYLLKQGVTQLKINSRKVPIERALEDPKISEEMKTKLIFAQEVKNYSEEHLGLAKSNNYNYYLPFDKPYLTYIVSAAPKYSMNPLLWSYPFVGSLPYKGFFDLDDAKGEAKRLDEKGYDTYIRGVTAYSTLGWFADPITKPQLENNSKASLAELIIHELTHTTVYFSGEGDFNETLAEFVAGEGTREFLIKKYGIKNSELTNWEKSHKDEVIWNEFVRDAVKALTTFYEKNKEATNKAELKANEYSRLREKFKTQYLPRIKNKKGYRSFLNKKENNAFLLSQYTYTKDPELFNKLYILSDSKMPLFIENIKSLKHRPKKESAFDALRALIDTKN